jgi:hypothetical protein
LRFVVLRVGSGAALCGGPILFGRWLAFASGRRLTLGRRCRWALGLRGWLTLGLGRRRAVLRRLGPGLRRWRLLRLGRLALWLLGRWAIVLTLALRVDLAIVRAARRVGPGRLDVRGLGCRARLLPYRRGDGLAGGVAVRRLWCLALR